MTTKQVKPPATLPVIPTHSRGRCCSHRCGRVVPCATGPTKSFFRLDFSVLPRLDHSVLDNVVDYCAVGIDRREHYPLGLPPRVGRSILLFPILGPRLRRDHGGGIKDGSEPSQRPLLAQPRRQDPFALRLRLHLEPACLTLGAGLSRAVGVLEQFDLLVGVCIEAVRREAREQRAREQLIGDGRGRVLDEVGPVVLMLEVVLDLAGERVQTGQVRLRGS